MAVTVEMRTQVSQLYVALFGRAPDAEGLGFWTQALADGASLTDIANSMYDTDPARSYYPLFLTNAEIITSFYTNVLGRAPDAEGLAYWTAKLNAPGATPGSVIVEIIDVVAHYTGTDPDGLISAALFANKVEVAQYYGEHGGSIAGATAVLVGVTDDHATVDAAIAALGGPGIGETLQLTAATDNITIAQPNTADTVQGIVDGDGDGDTSGSTLTPLDKIVGNGFTTVQLAVTETGNAAILTTLKNIKTVDLVAGTAGGIVFNAALWENIGKITLNAGSNGLWGAFTNLHAGVDLSVGTGGSGILSASYTDARGAWVHSEKMASVSYIDGGNIDATAGAGRAVSASVWANAGGVDLTVGDVTFAGNNADGMWFAVFNNSSEAGDITVGDLSFSGFDNEYWAINNTDHSAASAAGNVTVGDVLMQVGANAEGEGSIYNSGDGVVGNTTVGNVTLEVGDNGSASITVYQWGQDGAGDVTVGNVALQVGASATGSIYLANYAGWDVAPGAPIALGNMTVGDVSIDVGFNGTAYFSVSAEAYTTAAGRSASVGSYTVGDLAVTLAQDARLSVWMSQKASVSGLGASASVGDVSVGAFDATLAVDAGLSYSVNVSAYSHSGPGASVGNVVIGPVMLDMGINSDASVDYAVYAYGTATSQVHVGDVTIGAVNAVLDDGATLTYDVDITSYGDIGDVQLGAVGLQLGVSAYASVTLDVWASTDIASLELGDVNVSAGLNSTITMTFYAAASNGSIGDVRFGDVTAVGGPGAFIWLQHQVSASHNLGKVTIGDVSVSAAAPGAYVYASHDFSAWNGAIGNVNVGDVSVAAAASASAYYDFYMSGETAIGNVSIGDVSVSAVGAQAAATVYFDIENDGVGTIGNITVGDVAVTVNGELAYGRFFVSASSATSGGTVTVGDLHLAVGNAAQKTGALLDVDIGNDLGSVVVGDINLTGTSVRGAGDAAMTYAAAVSLWSSAAGGISIGNIMVAGGDGAADNFGNTFSIAGANWLSLSAGAQGVTLGGVDYSGYGDTGGVTLDVSGFKGNTTVVGSAFGDAITDNAGVNQLTGGAGADTFAFVDTNTGKTLGLIDKIMDFSNAQGDKIDLTPAVTVANYGEATYADFSAFLAGADAADKAAWVGLVGGDGFLAVDYDTNGSIDYVIQLVGLGSLANIDVASFV
ncbi:DUF4214 domain-containing protein [Immundisolibacter sp.]